MLCCCFTKTHLLWQKRLFWLMYRRDPANRTPFFGARRVLLTTVLCHTASTGRHSVSDSWRLSFWRSCPSRCDKQVDNASCAKICGKCFQIAFGSMHIGYRFCGKTTVRYEGQLWVKFIEKVANDWRITRWQGDWMGKSVILREMTPPPHPDHLNMNATVSRYIHLLQCCKLIM